MVYRSLGLVGKSKRPLYELGHSGFVLFVVVVDCLGLAEDLRPIQLVDLVGKVVGSRIALQSQLQLSHYRLVDGHLESDVRDRHVKAKATLDLKDFVGLRFTLHELLNQFNCLNDVTNVQEYALPPHHVRY